MFLTAIVPQKGKQYLAKIGKTIRLEKINKKVKNNNLPTILNKIDEKNEKNEKNEENFDEKEFLTVSTLSVTSEKMINKNEDKIHKIFVYDFNHEFTI